MLKKTLSSILHRPFSSSTPELPTLYSFLQPSIFAIKPNLSTQQQQNQSPNNQTLTETQKSTLETNLSNSLTTKDTDEAWKSFKSLTSVSSLPNKPLTNSLITHLSSLYADSHNLKRAFASAVYVMEKSPNLLDFNTVRTLLESMKMADAVGPAFALVKCMFKNRYFVPFEFWGSLLVDISRKNSGLVPFFRVLKECCRVTIDEKLGFMKPDLVACNAALEGCCKELESLSDAESLVETMAQLGIRPNELSFGLLGYLYALKGLDGKVKELENLISGFGFENKRVFYSHLISSLVKRGNLEGVSGIVLRSLKEGDGWGFGQDTYSEIVKAFIESKSIKGLAGLIIQAQKLESSSLELTNSVGYGVVCACVNLGFSDKAHCILDEMSTQGGSVGLGVYVPILKAYCKEHKTAEATQLVMEISSLGLELDTDMYDSLIEASMASQDFQSAFTLFRDMREARKPDPKGSYLTILTGLLENKRPELMAAFMDEIIEDPRIEVKTHDWNSIIHAFCKASRLEEARRTFRRMSFLQFEPNNQTYLSLINGYVSGEKYFNVLMLWHDVKKKASSDFEEKKSIKLDDTLVDAFLFALVKGGFFDAVMQVVEKSQEMRIFVDKWRYKQAFMEHHKKLRVPKLRKRNFKKMEAVIAFKNWVGLNT